MEYFPAIKEKEFQSVLVRWMNPGPIIHSKVRQKNKYSILMNIYIYIYVWNLEKCFWWTICREEIETQMWKMDLWTQWGRESGESSVSMRALSGVECSWWAVVVQDREPSLALWWLQGYNGGVEGGQGGRRWRYNCDWFALFYGGNQHNIVKKSLI